MFAYSNSLVFAIIIFIQEWFRYPFSGYTAFVVMTLYIGFDIGTINNRLMPRFWGAMLAGIFSLIYWYIGHLNYRFILVLIILGYFASFYFARYNYSTVIFFTMSLAFLGTGYLDIQGLQYSSTEFVTDVMVCTTIALFVVLILHEFCFSDKKIEVGLLYHLQRNFLVSIVNCENMLADATRLSIKWHNSHYSVLQDLQELKTFIDINQALLEKNIPNKQLQQFIHLAEDYYLKISLRVAMHKGYLAKEPLSLSPPIALLEQLLEYTNQARQNV